MRNKTKLGLVGLSLAGALTFGACETSKSYHLEPIGKTPSGETTYRKIPADEKTPENYSNGNSSTAGEVADFTLRTISCLFHFL